MKTIRSVRYVLGRNIYGDIIVRSFVCEVWRSFKDIDESSLEKIAREAALELMKYNESIYLVDPANSILKENPVFAHWAILQGMVLAESATAAKEAKDMIGFFIMSKKETLLNSQDQAE